ncbi:MAG: response regulator, partial [Ferruginibacter sp.]
HEIRTPMNAVLGMASLLRESNLTEEQSEYATTIINSGQTLLKVINEIMMNDILEYSKIESGKELEAKDIDLYNCIEEVLDVFAVKAAKAGVDLLYYVEDNVPLQIVGDVRRIRQILMNLVENAMRVTTKGEIFIGVQLVECKEDNRIKLEFEVRDTGAGMAADKAGILSKSFAVTNSATPADVTAGTGLIICKKLVALMGGSINVKSVEKEGTTFRFTIYSKAGMAPLRASVHADMADLVDKKILIVDDNETVCEILRRRLETLKMVASSVVSGKEALDILTQVSFDLVITDLSMPEMDGIQLAKQIRERYPATPVFLLKSVNDDRSKQAADIFSAELSKPIKPLLLLDAILNQLRNKDKSTVNKQNSAQKISDNFSKEYPLKILIAEDNPINQKWTAKILSKLGYTSEIANNGKEVLEVVSTNQYDLILMDVQMPVMDGLEATRMIRLCLEAQPVIIAMTANAMQGDKQDCFQSGMDDYISKPVELNEFVGKLEKWALLIKEKRQSYLQSRA